MMTAKHVAIASWAVAGVVILLADAVVRVSTVAIHGIRAGLSPLEWGALAVVSLVLGYVEGYRALSRSFGPRVVARAFELVPTSPVVHVLLAPLYAMSLIGDTRRRMIESWGVVAMIVAMVVLVQRLPPTWRCITDAGVALSLAWGLVAIASRWAMRLRREMIDP
jgi:hypothetical protein